MANGSVLMSAESLAPGIFDQFHQPPVEKTGHPVLRIWRATAGLMKKTILLAVGLASFCAASVGLHNSESKAVLAESGVTYNKVHDVSDLTDGDKLLFVSPDNNTVMGAASSNGKYRLSVTTNTGGSFGETIVEPVDSWCLVELQGTGSENTFCLYDTNIDHGYLHNDTSASKDVRKNSIYTDSSISKEDAIKTNGYSFVFKEDIDNDGLFTASIVGASTYYELSYNSSSPRWACYSGTQAGFYIYEQVASTYGETVRIEVSSKPSKVTYLVGESFSLDGLQIIGIDSQGNRKLIDNSLLVTDPAEGYTFTEEDVGENKEVGILYEEGDSLFELGGEAGSSWTYTVMSAEGIKTYSKLSKGEILLGSDVIIGGSYGGSSFAAGSLNQDKSILNIVSPTSSTDNDMSFEDSGSHAAEYEIRVIGEGSVALYSDIAGGYLTSSARGDISYSEYPDSEKSCWSLEWEGDQILLKNQDRYLAYNHNNGNPRIKAYSNINQSSYSKVSLYSLPQTPEAQAAELARYVMSEDKEGQCNTKFPVAKDAYLNLMNDDGRERFDVMEEQASERYLAWAVALGQNPYSDGESQSYVSPMTIGENNLLAICGSLALLTITACLGFALYKKRKQAR